MTGSPGLTTARVVQVIQDLERTQPPGEDGTSAYVGDGVLWCGLCGGSVQTGELLFGRSHHAPLDPRSEYYHCASSGCGQVAPVTTVHRELQAFTRQRLSETAFTATWSARRLAELDPQIAEARAVLAWCRDPRRRSQLRKPIERKPIGLGHLTWGDPYPDAVSSSLFSFAHQLMELIIERAEIAGSSEHGRPLQELETAYLNYAIAMAGTGMSLVPRRKVQRALGGRRQLARLEAVLDELRTRFWDLLEETQWRFTEPSRLPHKRAAEQDWAQSPIAQGPQRRALLRMAVGEDRLEIVPASGDGPRVRAIARGG